MKRPGPTEKGKGKGNECVICFGPWTVFMRLSESGLCIGDGWSITYPQLGQFHPTNLFLSLNLWCKDLAQQKKRKKDLKWVYWMFWPLDCLYVLIRKWTLYKRWLTKSWPVSPNKISSSVLICDAKTWSHKK